MTPGTARDGLLNKYRIFETDQFIRDLKSLSRSGLGKIEKKLREFVYPELGMHPRFGSNIRKLKGFSPDTWRYRIGNWRFFYEIDDDESIVFMTAASHRGTAYLKKR